MSTPQYEVYAIKYAHHARLKSENFTGGDPHDGPMPLDYSVAAMFEGYDRLRALADSPAHIIPGHDPLVLARYPAPSSALHGIVARLD